MAAVNVGGRAIGSTRGRWSRIGSSGGSKAAVLLPTLTVLLIAAALLSVGSGAVAISPAQVVAILLSKVGIVTDTAYSAQQAAVLWNIRLPRVVLAVLVGGGLAISGAALQGIFRNPLTDPGLIGVSSGAALGAVGAIIFGLTALGAFVLPIAAFIGGLLATLFVYGLARHDGRAEIVTLLLTGIAVNAICGAATGFLIFYASDAQLRSIVFWSFGSLGGATWRATLAVAPLIIVGTVLLPRWSRALNLLSLGEREARHLGVETERVRLVLIVLTALITGAAVAVCGTIGFIGLIVPHLLRLIAGPDHRTLLPASALGGAVLLTLADFFSRTVASPVEIPIGVITALAGGPFFLWLLCRTRRTHGGWG